MEHYATLFDGAFLPQGLALHTSLERHAKPYCLWVLCMDGVAYDSLKRLCLPNTRLLALDAVETPELRAVKPGRTRGEYCWTVTPFAPHFVFSADASVRRVTYLDADLWLCRSPEPVLSEFTASGKSVLITDHAYAPEHDQAARSGRFCVQFITFVRGEGELVRQWWADRCIEWCFNRVEPGRFGDQKYLDDWPQRFSNHVHVLQDKSLMQAPWNATRFPPSDAVAFHFQGLRLLSNERVLLTEDYQLPRPLLETHYRDYLADLHAAVARMQVAGIVVPRQALRGPVALWSRLVLKRLRAFFRGLATPATLPF
jgi:hypothetical protein